MTSMYVNVDIDIADVWIELTDKEREAFTVESIEAGYGNTAPAPKDAVELIGLALEKDPVAVLSVVTWLRANGYTVEPV